MKGKIDSKEVKSLLDAIIDLIEIKMIIRKTVPDYELDEKLMEKYINILESLQLKLLPLFSKYLNQSSEEIQIKSKEEIIKEIKTLSRDVNITLVSSNSAKKKLKNIGLDPRNIIVSGGPIFFNDYSKVNPNISDKAIPGIKRKCENLISKIAKINWEDKEFIFLYERDNITDKIILDELGKISELIGKKIITYLILSWKDLEF
ncbi:MAG: DUF2100 domain-containing protein [Candidatus Heimdallarchaeota archaeon]